MKSLSREFELEMSLLSVVRFFFLSYQFKVYLSSYIKWKLKISYVPSVVFSFEIVTISGFF